MATGNGSDRNSLLESHEDRLQRMETVVNDIHTTVGVNAVKNESNHRYLMDKLDHIVEKLDPVVDAVARLQDADRDDKTKLRALESANRERVVRFGKIKKAVTGLCLAGGGVLAAKLGDMLWVWLSRP